MDKTIIENLVKLIEEYRLDSSCCTNYDKFIFKRLENKSGFMVFGKDKYDKKEDSVICKKLGETIYKERLYYREQIPNKTNNNSIVFILFNPNIKCFSFIASKIYI